MVRTVLGRTGAGSGAVLLRASEVRKTFRTPDGAERLVLDRVSLDLHEGEIIALLGKSGAGKSTLLRLAAGLASPNGGEIRYRDRVVNAPVQGISMVFQSFALFPWLTVQGNVELGLEAMGVPRREREARAMAAIDQIGLGGFESAYPKELSGGMRQQVGFARALVTNPDVLLLDEPFSALDVMTAENLRHDLLELWRSRSIPTKGILLVSHNIAEAVGMADRILIFSSDPATVRAEIPVPLDHPRDPDGAAFRQIVDEVYTLMTTASHREQVGAAGAAAGAITLGYRLPDATPARLEGLMEALAEPPFNGHADLPKLADATELSDDVLFPLFEGLRILGFAGIARGDITLTTAGRAYVVADTPTRKEIFAGQLLHHIPLAARIRRVLDERPHHRAPEDRFLQELEDYLTDEEADRVLQVVINWGRFAEVFEYDYNSGILALSEDEEDAAPAEE
ncbi:MAG: nitrate/sulfonate/bicarbonate ABC transporter ATP-binding protein [Alphaproteobacteria bacterium]